MAGPSGPIGTSMPYWVRRRIFQRELGLSDFAGGLNLRDAPSELANNESPDLWNVTLNERGGVEKRLGQIKHNGSPFTTAHPPQNIFRGETLGITVTQCGPDLFKNVAAASVHTFSTSDRAAFAEFGTEIFAIHPVDGLFFTADGSTWTHIVGAPPGSTLEPWQNRLLSGGDPSNPPRLSASAIGDGHNWSVTTNDRQGTDAAVTGGSATVTSATAAFTAGDVSKAIALAGVTYHIESVTNATTIVLTTNYAAGSATGVAWAISGDGWFNDIREHDSEILVAIKSASGIDIAGKPGVLVFKARSTYRVNDGNNGSYQTLDTTSGAASAISVVNLYNMTFILCPAGIYSTTGVSALKLDSARLQPLFTPAGVAFDHASLFCAGRKGDRVHFSMPRAGSTANDLHLEYHPAQGWIVAGSDAVSCYETDTTGGETLLGGSPTVAGQVYEMGTGGSDDGSAIACYYQTKWLAPEGGIDCRFRRLRVFSRGTFKLYVKRDFDLGQGDENQVVPPVDGIMVWKNGGASTGDDQWDVDKWGPLTYESSQDFWSLGNGKYVSFRLEETSTLVVNGPLMLGAGTAPQAGAFAMYSLALQFIPLSI